MNPGLAALVVLWGGLSPLFDELCAPCHGPGGRGDGPAAGLYLPPPRDLVSGALRNGETLEALGATLRQGFPMTGMPAFGALPTGQIEALVADVLTLRRGTVPAAKPPLWPLGPLEAPPGTPPVAESLSASQCGRCHPAQAESWAASRHARAFSAGVSLQLGEPPSPACTACHAPLAEQQHDRLLRDEGVTCAACHRRGVHKLTARPAPGRHVSPLPLQVEPALAQSVQCLPCHNLPLGSQVAGKPLLDTWREWAASPYLPARVPCQTCHYAQGDHALRGAHDPEAVRRAVRLDVRFEGGRAVATVRNIGAGHAFPTTATPRAVLRLRQLDAGGAPLPGTEDTWAIGRTVESSDGGRTWRQLADTRIPPGAESRWPYVRPRAPSAASLEVELFMYPDWFYSRVFRAHPRFEPALREAAGSGFRVTGARWPLPAP